jgi:hypothetical protein
MNQTARAPRTRYTSVAGNFSNPRITFHHEATGIIFTVKGGRMNVQVPDPDYHDQLTTIGTKWLGPYDQSPQPTPSAHACRAAAAKWLNENPEEVARYA